MNFPSLKLIPALGVALACNASGATRFVDLNSPSPTPPYTNWATAATNIQSAIDAAVAGDQILVSNGVYRAGSRVVLGAMNRVALTRPLALQSVNGPAVTLIDGDGGMRCAYLVNGTSLAGFTLTNGATTGNGGGLWCESTNVLVSNCVLTRNFVGSDSDSRGGGVFSGTLTNCRLTGNRSTTEGGGAYASVLFGCVLSENAATNYGGGASSCTLTGCTLTNNSATYGGGGGYLSALSNCALIANQSYDAGGGALSCTLDRCSLTGNYAAGGGGGSAYSTLHNCAVAGNSTGYAGGGTQGGTNVNCTITGNSGFTVGGADGGSLSNCIVYFNRATRRDNYSVDAALDHCCTTPIPFSGTGNLAADPRLASASHLSADSPCRGAGSAGVVTGTDIDGQAWANPPAMGCDEFLAGSTGALTVAIRSAYTNVAAGFAVDFTPQISGAVTASRWDFGDGTVVTNQPYYSHRWAAPGDYVVVLSAYNNSALAGVSASLTIHVLPQPVHYVVLNNVGPVPPYNSWATAAANIQDAVDAATIPGALVLVSNGTYQVGQRVIYGAAANRVAVTNPIVVQSVNGPAVTVIRGASPVGVSAVRCVYLAAGATLAGFRLTNGASAQGGDWIREESGGGAWCEASSSTLSNCVLAGNSSNSEGGGVMGGSLFDCILATNSAYGGAASYSALSNCTLIGNLAYSAGGGASLCTLRACSLIGNSAPNWYGLGGGAAYSCVMEDCTVASNSAYYAGGVVSSILNRCTLNGNSSDTGGGGAGASQLYDSRLFENHAWSGGGADASTLDRCVVSSNSASYGAGVAGSTLRNCAIFGNASKSAGGGTDGGTLNNCTLTGNSAATGGGASGGTLTNCIVYYNTAATAPNYSGGALSYCCTTPLPAGVGNLAAEPELANLSHISAASPCRGAGNSAAASGTDIDGEVWAAPPSIGCDELGGGAATGNLSVAISAAFTNVVPGLELNFAGQITGHVAASRWEFGDGTVLSNRPYASHGWAALGVYPLVLRAFNDSFPAGVSATVTVHVVTAPTHYVAVSNGTPASPFTSWASAATNIQDAVDAVITAGALVLVSNGVYGAGSRLVNNNVPHRLVVTKPITVQSVNGPGVTAIQGQPAAGHIRCAYLASGAALVGLTLTNGQTRFIWEEPPFEDMIGGGVWCESTSALLSNCVIVACSAGSVGGGVYGGTLNYCTLLNNSTAHQGGGAYLSILNHCVLRNNTAHWYGSGTGGGAASSALDQCALADNGADTGGGAGLSTLNNCTLTANTAATGGAADNCTLRNCALTANAASALGGGANSSALYNCTVTGNAATNSGGGVANCTNLNSLVFYNFAPASSNWAGGSFSYSCTLPLPAGAGNLAAEPQLADAIHLSAGSPCRGTGLAAAANGADIDGEPWLNPPSTGCDEFMAGASSGVLSVAIFAPYTNVAVGYTLDFRALINGHASASVWDFGDGTVVSNRPFTSHSWAIPGDYTVALTVFNDAFPTGVSTGLTVHVQSPLHYVALDNPTPVAPYSSWATAATNIQDAVDATFVGGTIMVSNGVYQIGGAVASGIVSNRVAVTRQMTLRSVNGPAVTVIQGSQPNGTSAVRCVSLVRGATLSGFTLRNGGTRTDGDGDADQTGGGAWCDSVAVVISNCVITANSANGAAGVMRGTFYNCAISTNSPTGAAGSVLNDCSVLGNTGTGAGGCIMNNCLVQGNSAYDGGGVGGCLLTNCTITGNHAARYGGGSQASTMYNCLVTGNSAGSGGGGIYNDWMYNCTIVGNSSSGHGGGVLIASTLNNCIIYHNTAPNGPNYWSDYLAYCCTTPFYAGGPGNITNAPLFVNEATGNLRLQPQSPCINSGYNDYAPDGLDFDGNPRIVGGTVDIGAFEFQSSAFSVISFAWLQQFGLPTDGSADYADADGDGMNNWQEWRADTNPTNALSVLRMVNATNSPDGAQVTWQSVATRAYWLARATDLGAVAPFQTVATNIAGAAGTTTFTDTSATNGGPYFYRVGVP